jgi:hypothetical protein
MVALASVASAAPGVMPVEKRQEIQKMLRLTGVEKLMGQMLTQLMGGLRAQMPDVPEVFWTKFQQKIDTHELMDKIIPLYDKYYTTEDLKAINAFYESPAGQKVLRTLPQIMQESVKVGQEWGERIGKQAAEEAEIEMKKSGQQ